MSDPCHGEYFEEFGFLDPFAVGQDLKFEITSANPITQTGRRLVRGNISGLSKIPGQSDYRGYHQIGIYVKTDILYNTPDDRNQWDKSAYKLTDDDIDQGEFSTRRRLYTGTKIIRLERKDGRFPITDITTSKVKNSAQIVVKGRPGVAITANMIESDITYFVMGTGFVSYMGMRYDSGKRFIGLSDHPSLIVNGVVRVNRKLEFGDEFYIEAGKNLEINGLYHVFETNYSAYKDEMTILTQEPIPVGDSGGHVVPVIPIASS